MQRKYDEVGDEAEEDEEGEGEDEGNDGGQMRFYAVCFLLSFVVLFSIFSLILWAASLAYKPRIVMKVRPNFDFSCVFLFFLFFWCLVV